MFGIRTLAALISVSLFSIGPVTAGDDDKKADPPTAATATHTLGVNDIVDGMQKYYEASTSYAADFDQVYEDVTQTKKTSKGKVFFKKPGKMHWHYTSPEEKYLISDGADFWAWEPAYDQYCEQSLANASLPSALTFLAGEGDIQNDFDVKLLGETKDAKWYKLELVPKVPNNNYAFLEFTVKKSSFKVGRVVIEDYLGNRNTLTFKKVHLNGDMADENFTFEPPKGANHLCETAPGGK